MQVDESKILMFTEKKAKPFGSTCYVSIPRKFMGKKVKIFIMQDDRYFR